MALGDSTLLIGVCATDVCRRVCNVLGAWGNDVGPPHPFDAWASAARLPQKILVHIVAPKGVVCRLDIGPWILVPSTKPILRGSTSVLGLGTWEVPPGMSLLGLLIAIVVHELSMRSPYPSSCALVYGRKEPILEVGILSCRPYILSPMLISQVWNTFQY